MELSNILKVTSLISKSNEEIVQFLRRNLRCRRCRRQCTSIRKRGANSLDTIFKCARCGIITSALYQSFFDNIRLSIRKVILLMWFWYCQTRSGTTRQHTNMARKTAVQINRFLRDITSWKLLQDEYLLGKIYFAIQYNFYYKIKKIYIQDPCLHFSFAL